MANVLKPKRRQGVGAPTPAQLQTGELAVGIGDRALYVKNDAGEIVELLDPTLKALAGVTTAANKLIYATGADTFATCTLTLLARDLLDDADPATMRATLGISQELTTAPTAPAGTNTTQIATTEFVQNAVNLNQGAYTDYTGNSARVLGVTYTNTNTTRLVWIRYSWTSTQTVTIGGVAYVGFAGSGLTSSTDDNTFFVVKPNQTYSITGGAKANWIEFQY